MLLYFDYIFCYVICLHFIYIDIYIYIYVFILCVMCARPRTYVRAHTCVRIQFQEGYLHRLSSVY